MSSLNVAFPRQGITSFTSSGPFFSWAAASLLNIQRKCLRMLSNKHIALVDTLSIIRDLIKKGNMLSSLKDTTKNWLGMVSLSLPIGQTILFSPRNRSAGLYGLNPTDLKNKYKKIWRDVFSSAPCDIWSVATAKWMMVYQADYGLIDWSTVGYWNGGSAV